MDVCILMYKFLNLCLTGRTSTPRRSPADCLIVYFSTEIYTLTSIFTLIDIVRWCCPIHWSKTRKVNITIHDINVGDCRTLWLRSYRVRGFEHYDQSIVDTIIFILNTILFHIITITFYISTSIMCMFTLVWVLYYHYALLNLVSEYNDKYSPPKKNQKI